jgi:signal transduction histidine kinase
MVGTAAYFLMGRATHPLKLFGAKASEVGRDLDSPPLDEHGPVEVRSAARAYNQMQHRLQRLVSGRTEMLAAISHDMRTPLSRLRLRIEFLEEGEDRSRLLQTLDEMEAMVLSVLEFLRGSAPTEQPRDVDIAALVDSICLDMNSTGMPVALHGRYPSLRLRCRPAVLRRAIENLVDNAVRYGGSARVTIAHDEHEIRIEVRDKGPGIPEDQLHRIVQPFIRGDSSRSRNTGGHGLGLSTALTIAHAHGGSLKLENDPGGGLLASLILPR